MKLKEKKVISDIRLLSLDMIDHAKSGHPGIALGAAPMLYTLFAYHLNFDLEKKDWANRDRFVMSAGHGSALLYATLFATLEEYTLDDLKKFRVLNSPTTGHPEYDLDHRIESSTGVLGQGFANAVGMAMAEKQLESIYNTKKNTLFDYNVYALCSEGDLMEGIAYESAFIAGDLALDNLIVLYDANYISLDGDLDPEHNESVINTFSSLKWNVLEVKNGESVSEIDKAINAAKKSKSPTLIVVNTIIGKYSQYENTNKVHGAPLEEEDLENIRTILKGGDPFTYDRENILLLREYIKSRVFNNYEDWLKSYEFFESKATDKEIDRLDSIINNESITLQLDKVIDTSKLFLSKTMRDINYQVMNVIAAFVPNFIGGSADLASSTKTYLKGKGNYSYEDYTGRNISFGVREQAMGGILNGLSLSNYRVFGSTFLAFADHLKPSIRMSCLMNLPVTYIFTHDTFLVGQDGPTHEPIEQLGMLRSIPNFNVYRPCDYKELIGAWNIILNDAKPSALVLSKSHTESYKFTSEEEIKHGGYVISEVKTKLDVIIIASGSEVTFAMKLKEELLKNYIEARIVSMPNVNLFLEQDEDYQTQVLPKGYKRVVLEFSNDPIWYSLINDKNDLINITSFGKSGKPNELLQEFELDIASLVIDIKNSL